MLQILSFTASETRFSSFKLAGTCFQLISAYNRTGLFKNPERIHLHKLLGGTMAVLVGREAPNFSATAVFGDDFKEIHLSDYRGKYVLLFFYPLDFTFVCPTELHAFQARMEEFNHREVEVLACSVDSQFSHQAWLKTPKSEGGIEGITYGLISDLGGNIAREFDVLNPDNVAYRGLFLIDQEGIVRHQLVNDTPLGRNVEEAVRMIDALQHYEKYGENCPADWNTGQKGLKANKESVIKYLNEKH